MSVNEDSKIFIIVDIDIEFDDLIKFEIVTLLDNGTIPMRREVDYFSQNDREFQRELRVRELSEFNNM